MYQTLVLALNATKSQKPGKEARWRRERKWFIYWFQDRRLPGVSRTSNDTRIKPQTILYDLTSGHVINLVSIAIGSCIRG